MTKVLLINPRFSEFHVDPDSDLESLPIGLVCLGSFLVSRGFAVKLVDCLATTNYWEVIEAELESCLCAGISVMTSQVPEAVKISQFIRDKEPSTPIIWGGPHPSLFPEQTASDPIVDYVVRGEGELTLLELIEALQSDLDRQRIKGLTYLGKHGIVGTEEREFMDMDDLPPINWDLFDPSILSRIILVPAHTSRGCSHRCTFCINSVTKNRWRSRSPEKVLDELDLIKERFGDTRVRFWDENFFGKKERALKIVEGIYERGIDIQWETTVRADYFNQNYIDDEFLFKLKGSGCYKLAFGAESGSQRILDMLHKDITVEDLMLSDIQCAKFDITPEYSFMVGLPTENSEDIQMTIHVFDKLRKANKKAIFLGPQVLRPYPGAQLYEQCVEHGWRVPTSLKEWAEVTENERSYLSPRNFPWVSEPDYIEAIGPYLSYALKDTKILLSTGLHINKFFKLLFIIAAKLRWKLKYFRHPIEYRIAKYIIK